MIWSDITRHPTARALRQFAGGWLVFFLALGAHQHLLRKHPTSGLVLMAIALVIGALGLIKPVAVRWLFTASMVVAFPLGWLVSLLMLLVMFYGLITPIALLFRLWGRDLLRREPAPSASTFWLPKHSPRDVRSYFRQY